MPASATDLSPETVSISLNTWKGVTFCLTDKELAYTKEVIIQEHIRPAAVAVADAIDADLCALYKDVPWYVAADGSVPVNDFTNCWKILFENKVPMQDLHMMVNGTLMAGYMGLSAFAQWQGAGAEGVNTQMNGTLGKKYGFEVFSNQNVPTHDSGVAADAAGAANAQAEIGDTTLVIKSVTAGATVKTGDIIVITGDAQQYVVTANASDGNSDGVISVTIAPALKQQCLADTVVTIFLDESPNCLAFNRNAFALAMAPLSDLGGQLGAQIATVTDPITGLSLRSRLWYDGATAKVYVSIDALWGVKTLNPNMAVRLLA
jgi:hypothetical protein